MRQLIFIFIAMFALSGFATEKLLPNIPSSEGNSPQQIRDTKKYPLPSMYLRFLEKNGEAINKRIVEEGRRIKKSVPSMEILLPPLKSKSDKGLDRVKEKTLNDYSGNMKQMKDISRVSYVFQSLNDLEKGYKLFKKSKIFTVEFVKNRFDNPAPGGYMDLTIISKDNKTKILFEVQFHLCSIINAKKQAHKQYERMRTIDGKANVQQRELTHAEQKEVSRLMRESETIYRKALNNSSVGKKCILQSNQYLVN